MFWTVTLSILQGCSQAVKLFFLTLLFALPLGLVVAFGSMSKWAPFRALAYRQQEARGFARWLSQLRPLSALTNVHRVIDELDMDVTVLEEDADGKAFSDLLKATMADGDRRLRALGFDITSILHVAGGAPSASPSLAGIANDLLRETYANIARHAQSGSKADLSVILKPNAVEITQINQERAFPTEGMRPGGHGLAYFGKQLESHGGKLETTLHDGEWTLFAYLPIPVPETLPPLAGHPES